MTFPQHASLISPFSLCLLLHFTLLLTLYFLASKVFQCFLFVMFQPPFPQCFILLCLFISHLHAVALCQTDGNKRFGNVYTSLCVGCLHVFVRSMLLYDVYLCVCASVHSSPRPVHVTSLSEYSRPYFCLCNTGA